MPRSGPHRYDAYARAHKDDTAKAMAARRKYEKENGPIPKGWDVDHRKSIKAGGSNDMSNLRPRRARENRGDKTFHD